MLRKKILIISFSYLPIDNRVLRQIGFLKDVYDVTIVGYGRVEMEGVRCIALTHKEKPFLRKARDAALLLGGFFESYYWNKPAILDCLDSVGKESFDLFLANDIDALPVALRLASGKPVILDAHEYFPEEFEEDWVWRAFYKRYKTYLCRRYLPQAAEMMTVCEGIAGAYEPFYGKKPHVVTNACHYYDLKVSPSTGFPLRLIYQGAAHPSRKIEVIVDAMRLLDDRFHLDLLLVPSDKVYYEHIASMSSGVNNVALRAPVPMKELVSYCHSYDVGLFVLPPTSLNNRHSLPNKFFEYLQARLAIVVGPSVEMARIVQEEGVGVVTEDFSSTSLALALSELTPDKVNRYKERAHEAASRHCAEENEKKVLEIVRLAQGNV